MSTLNIFDDKVVVMKKKIILLFLVFIAMTNLGAFGRPKKVKCNKPIYFFENVQKADYFNYIDELIQAQNYDLKKFYPELGFMSIAYKVKRGEPEIVGLSLKQFGNDVYLFIDISKSDTELERYLYKDLKKYSKNSYLLRNDYFCKELTKDVKLINTRRKNHVTDDVYNPLTYKISLKRYVGYDKKKYFRFRKSKEEKEAEKQRKKEIEEYKKKNNL